MSSIWLLGRRGAASRPGGDAMQLQETAEALLAAGWRVREAERAQEVRPRPGESVQLFNIQRCLDWGDLPERARRAKARLVLTPLFHPIELYHREGRRGLDRLAARLVPDPYRYAGLRWLRPDLRRRGRALLEAADRILLAHEEEADLLRRCFGAHLDPGALRVVPVAVHPATKQPGAAFLPPFGRGRPFVLCAGRVEPLKNPLGVLAASRSLGLPVAFAGGLPRRRHMAHSLRFRATVRRSGRDAACWLGELPPARLRERMDQARVHVLGSWTEVVGRVTLEAALAGAAVVLSDVGFAPPMLGRDTPGVFLARPGDAGSLRRALEAAWAHGRHPDGPLARRVRERYLWPTVAPQLLRALAG